MKLCTALGMQEFADDPRFASWLLRIQNSEALLPIIEKRFGEKPRAEWLEILAAHDIPSAPVKTIQEFMNDPGVQHQDMVHEYEHPEVGRLRVMGQPLAFAGTPTRDPGPPPTLGQHTDQVLRELGLVLCEQGDFVRAAALFEEGVALHRSSGDRASMAFSLIGLADVARDQGDSAGVLEHCEPSLAILRELGMLWAIGFALNTLALGAYYEGDLTRAFALIDESVSLFRDLQSDASLAEVLRGEGRSGRLLTPAGVVRWLQEKI